MRKGTKILLNIVYSVLGVLLLAAFLFHFLAPGIPMEKIGEDGQRIACLALPNGDYTGEAVLGFMDGKGTFVFDTGEVYEGQWKLQQMSGEGKLTSTEGNYEGSFQKSMRSGSGTFVWNDGSKYVGQWANDMLNGEGELTTAAGFTYKGTFQDDALYEGKISGTYGDKQFSMDVTAGTTSNKISVTFPDGVTYYGEFDGGCLSGRGEMTFPGVGKYEGSFENNKRNGDGTFTWDDGPVYDGEWDNDVFDGYGTYNFDANTSIYGYFEQGKLNGSYTYKNADGKFLTVWEDGKCTSIRAN